MENKGKEGDGNEGTSVGLEKNLVKVERIGFRCTLRIRETLVEVDKADERRLDNERSGREVRGM